MDRKKYIVEASDDVKKVIALGVTHGGAIWTDTTDIENLEELNSDYINEHFGDLQDTIYKKGLHDGESKCRYCNEYQRGLDDAWEAARKVAFNSDDGGLSIDELDEIFGCYSLQGVFKAYSAQQTIAKLKAYEEKKADDEIKVGDEVIYNGTTKCIVVRPENDERYASLIDSDGTHYSADHRECKKTGRHFDIQKILAEMRT